MNGSADLIGCVPNFIGRQMALAGPPGVLYLPADAIGHLIERYRQRCGLPKLNHVASSERQSNYTAVWDGGGGGGNEWTRTWWKILKFSHTIQPESEKIVTLTLCNILAPDSNVAVKRCQNEDECRVDVDGRKMSKRGELVGRWPPVGTGRRSLNSRSTEPEVTDSPDTTVLIFNIFWYYIAADRRINVRRCKRGLLEYRSGMDRQSLQLQCPLSVINSFHPALWGGSSNVFFFMFFFPHKMFFTYLGVDNIIFCWRW